MPSGTGLKAFEEKFKDRYFDVGIAEEHAVVFAAGLAREGLKPVVAIYSTFLQRSYDQLIHDVALQNLPVVFVLDRAGIVGEDGPTHHGIFDLSYLRHIPNFVVAVPKDENELKHLLYTAILSNKPFAIRYPRGSAVGVKIDEEYKKIDIGSWEIEKVYGDGNFHLLVLATGPFVHRIKEVCEKLSKKHNIKITLVNARFIKPMDEKLLKSLVKEANKIVTIEENTILGGFGSGVLEFINKENIYKPLLQIGIEDFFPPHGPQEVVRDYCGLSNSKIFEKIEDFIFKNTCSFVPL
jgi:1-deoxy-D-xylulose-5-phosphate synthase